MSGSTLGVLVRIRGALGGEGRTLTVRAPSRMTRRVLDICGLSDLVEVAADAAPSPANKAP